MTAQIFCPKCDRPCWVKEELLHCRVRCPRCNEVFRAEEVPVADAEPPANELLKFRSSGVETLLDDGQITESIVKPGVRSNPFEETSGLQPASAPVDPSAFEFDIGGTTEPLKKKKVSRNPTQASAKRQEDNRRVHGEIDDRERADSVVNPSLTVPVRVTAPRPAPVKSKRPPAPRPAEGKPESPFNFGTADEKPAAIDDTRPPGAHHDKKDEPPAEKPKRPAARKAPVNKLDADAAVLGLQNLDESPPISSAWREHLDTAFSGLQDTQEPQPSSSDDAKTEPTKERRPYFHVRQSGFWGRDARLFRVFVEDGELVFITAAAGKDVGQLEEALQSGSFDKCETRARNKLANLDEAPVEELADNDRFSSRLPVEKIKAASIDIRPFGLLKRRGAAIFRFEHKSKGEMIFDLSSDGDVKRAIQYLPDLLDQILKVNVRWDRAKKSFVAR
jgi:hypothetical protein